LELIAEEEPFGIDIEEEPPLVEPVMGGVFDFAAEAAEPVPYLSGFAAVEPAVAAATAAPATPVAARTSVCGETTLSEEQLASIVARISRDIIEKIAWEVIPDLAETLIRDEIRKIREGR